MPATELRPAPPLARAGALALLAAAGSGCAALLPGHGRAPSGLAAPEEELRVSLTRGEWDDALAAVGPQGEVEPGDPLLERMYLGLVAHYAGRYGESSEALVAAEALAEERVTKSVSRALLSLLAGDRVLAYDPEPTERLLLHYYDALNWLRLGERDEAAVAARRLSHLLDLYAERPATSAEERLRAALRVFAGAVFEAAGEENDARVAYRLGSPGSGRAGAAGPFPLPGEASEIGREAERAEDEREPWPFDLAAGEPEAFGPAAASPDSPPGGTGPAGEVVLVVETGFVAHRAEESLTLLLWPHELDVLTAAGPAARAGLTSCLTDLLLGTPLEEGAPPPREGPDVAFLVGERGTRLDPRDRNRCVEPPAAAAREAPRTRAGDADAGEGKKRASDRRRELPRLLRLAWPVYRRSPSPGEPRVALASGVPLPPAVTVNVSDAVEAEFRRGAPLRFATTLARAALKQAAARALEEEAREEDETLGDVIGILADAGAALLERADTRGWHLLPDGIALFRLRLPAGEQRLALELTRDGETRRVEVGPLVVRAGALEVVSVRAWSHSAVGPPGGPR